MFVFCLSSPILVACAGGKRAAGERAAATDNRPNSPANVKENEGNAADSVRIPLPPEATFLDAEFRVVVRTLGARLCEGTVNIKVNAAIDKQNTPKLFEIPSGMIDCRIHKFDLAQILGAAMAKTPSKLPIEESLVVQNSIISMKQLGGGLYTPPRPVFPSFIASERSVLATIDQRTSLRLEDQKNGKTSDGEIRLKVNAVGVPYTLATMGLSFPTTLQFGLEMSGFEGANKPENFIFEKMVFVMSLAPVALLHLDFAGPVSDLASGASSVGVDIPIPDTGIIGDFAKMIGDLIPVEISMDLIKMQNLEESLKNTLQSGPIIGQ